MARNCLSLTLTLTGYTVNAASNHAVQHQLLVCC